MTSCSDPCWFCSRHYLMQQKRTVILEISSRINTFQHPETHITSKSTLWILPHVIHNVNPPFNATSVNFFLWILHIFILLYKNTLLLRVCFSRHVNVSRQLFSKMKFPAIVLTISKKFTVETLLWPLQKILRQAVTHSQTIHTTFTLLCKSTPTV